MNMIWLLHGTSKEAVGDILCEGFKDSKKGTFRKGVYLTNCSSIAYSYALVKDQPLSSDWTKKLYIFLVEVTNANELEYLDYDTSFDGLLQIICSFWSFFK